MVKKSAFVLVALLLASCTASRTEVMLIVDTDLRVPGEMDNFRVEVTAPDGATTTSAALLGLGHPALPRTLGLAHEEGPLGPFLVRVVGGIGSAARVERSARFTFQEGRTLVLRIDLLAACASVTCGAGQTCAAGACRSIEIAPGELTEWTGPPPPREVDAAVPPDFGGVDAGPADSGQIDEGVDAGPPDGGPTDLGVDLCSPSSEICNGIDDDCNGTIDDGFDLQTDLMNCGSCGTVCDFQHATGGTCALGVCTFTACDVGFTDCNSDGVDGCEADLVTDRNNCGMCGLRCMGGRNCCASMCSRTCP